MSLCSGKKPGLVLIIEKIKFFLQIKPLKQNAEMKVGQHDN
jgi:hypothetical protein